MTDLYFLRRKGFGASSCQGIADKMTHKAEVLLSGSYEPVGSSTVVRWGCTATLLKKPLAEVSYVNKAKGIHEVYDKITSRLALWDADLTVPTWDNPNDIRDGYDAEFTTGPWVVRPRNHKQGKNLDLCHNVQEVYAAFHKYGEAYVSEFCDKVSEFRVVVFAGRVLFVYEKIPEDASNVAWNHAQGATTPNTKWGQWDENVVWAATEAMKLFPDLTFGAVDIMMDAEGEVYVLEINTAPETTSEYRQTCFAKAFDYSLDNSFDTIPVPIYDNYSWKYYIHPAISEMVIV